MKKLLGGLVLLAALLWQRKAQVPELSKKRREHFEHLMRDSLRLLMFRDHKKTSLTRLSEEQLHDLGALEFVPSIERKHFEISAWNRGSESAVFQQIVLCSQGEFPRARYRKVDLLNAGALFHFTRTYWSLLPQACQEELKQFEAHYC